MASMSWDLDTTLGKLHRFWWWCVDYCEDGDLRKHNDTRIAQAMGVAIADARRLVEAMVESRWIDRQPYFRVHDWWHYFGLFLQRKYGERHKEKWERVRELYNSCAITAQPLSPPNLPNLPNLPNHIPPPSARARDCADESEIPTEQQAVEMAAKAGVPDDFARYVFADWSDRGGRDAAGNVVSYARYVAKRWSREQVEWKAGTHRGNKKPAAKSVGDAQRPKFASTIKSQIAVIEEEIAALSRSKHTLEWSGGGGGIGVQRKVYPPDVAEKLKALNARKAELKKELLQC